MKCSQMGQGQMRFFFLFIQDLHEIFPNGSGRRDCFSRIYIKYPQMVLAHIRITYISLADFNLGPEPCENFLNQICHLLLNIPILNLTIIKIIYVTKNLFHLVDENIFIFSHSETDILK